MSDEQKTLVFIDREGKPGGGKGLLISKELTFTLSGLRQNLLVWEKEDERCDRFSNQISANPHQR